MNLDASENHSSRARIALLIVCAIGSFLTFLDRRDIVTSHEARVVQTARQMAASGWPWNAARAEVPIVGLITENGDRRLGPLSDANGGAGTMRVNPWLVPVINGNVRLQKPPLPYWCTAIAFRLFGYNDQAARWITALLGAGCTLLIAGVAREIFGRRSALLAAAVWVSTQFIVDEFRKSLADPYLAFATLLAVWAWLRAASAKAPRTRLNWNLLFYFALAIGALAKGPVILLIVLPALLVKRMTRPTRRTPMPFAHAWGVVLFIVLVAPWIIYVARHVPHAIELWRYESIGEFGDNAEKARPWWLYFPTALQLPLPWVPIWIAGLVLCFRKLRSPRGKRRLFAVGWFAIVLVAFSFANVKKNAYLLPGMAAQTLIVADGLRVTLAFARRTRLGGMSGVLLLAQCIIGIGFAIGLLVVATRLHVDRSATVTVCIAAMLFSSATIIPIIRRVPDAWLAMQTAAYVAILIALLGFYRSAQDNLRSPRAFANEAIQYSEANQLPFATTLLPEEASVYMPLDYLHDASATTNSASSTLLVTVDDSRLAIDHGLITPDADFFRPYVADLPILKVRRVHLDLEEQFLRWKLYEVTIDRTRI